MSLIIPYHRQDTPQLCGPAALCMVLESLGLMVTQEELMPLVTRAVRGQLQAFTHLMNRLCLDRGLASLIVRLKRGASVDLQQLRIIALLQQIHGGHYIVLVNCDSESVLYHDPLRGPNQQMSLAEFARRGGIALAIGLRPSAESEPVTKSCPWCRESVVLQPAAILGVIEQIHCPRCDLPFSPLHDPAAKS
jgi:ABC-type bacteriocin/lantibiotic exporter with double-glycine peptidase domain